MLQLQLTAQQRTKMHLLKTSSIKTRLIAVLIIIVVAVSGIVVIGQMPVNRTNIEHSDPLGDVTDANIDIVLIKSYLNGTNLYLQMTVASEIVKTNATFAYQYSILVIAEGISEGSNAFEYLLSYVNGSLTESPYSPCSYVNGTTLTIVVPISMIRQGDYMTGLEGFADNSLERDLTVSDRDGEVAHLWF